jgi:hypothetical protein
MASTTTIELTTGEVERLISALDSELEALEKFGHPDDPGHEVRVARVERLRTKLQRTIRVA